MNSFIKYIPKSLTDHKAFVELLLSIIDTKLQFVKHRTNTLISSYANPIINTDEIEYEDISMDMMNTPLEGEQVFSLIEKYSKTTNLLLLMRTKLNKKNVSLIYDLLNNDRYLKYENEELEKLLEKSMF